MHLPFIAIKNDIEMGYENLTYEGYWGDYRFEITTHKHDECITFYMEDAVSECIFNIKYEHFLPMDYRMYLGWVNSNLYYLSVGK